MLKKTVTYEDFNGKEVTEDFYFHLSEAELMEMELGTEGGFRDSIQKIVDSKDGKGIVDTFKKIILASYGEKSEDGRRFVKNEQLREEFQQHAAFSSMFIEFSTDARAAAEFINGIVPSKAQQSQEVIDREVARVQAEVEGTPAPAEPTPAPALEAVPEQPAGAEDSVKLGYQDFSKEELLAMPQDQFQELVGTSDPNKMTREQLAIAFQRKNQAQQ
jgi:hypothetical protein